MRRSLAGVALVIVVGCGGPGPRATPTPSPSPPAEVPTLFAPTAASEATATPVPTAEPAQEASRPGDERISVAETVTLTIYDEDGKVVGGTRQP